MSGVIIPTESQKVRETKQTGWNIVTLEALTTFVAEACGPLSKESETTLTKGLTALDGLGQVDFTQEATQKRLTLLVFRNTKQKCPEHYKMYAKLSRRKAA